MTFPTKLLGPGEEVYLDSRPNWSLLFWPAVLTLAVLAGCVAAGVIWTSAPAHTALLLLGCGFLAIVYFAVRYLGWRTTTFVVTSQRIVYRTGVIRRTGREIPIGRVQDVTYHQTVIERMVRAGSLTVESAGRSGQDPFPDISRPAQVQSLVNRVVAQSTAGYVSGPMPPASIAATRQAEVSQPVTDPTPPVAPPAPYHAPVPGPAPTAAQASAPGAQAPSIAQQMAELAELHRHGIITDAEYEQKRREMLDRL